MKHQRFLAAAICAGAAILIANMGGCTTPQLVCDAIQECEHSNDRAHEVCKISWSQRRDTASAYECDKEFDDYADCATTADCDDNRHQLGEDCKSEVKDLSECQADASDLGGKTTVDDDNGGTSGGGSSCKDIIIEQLTGPGATACQNSCNDVLISCLDDDCSNASGCATAPSPYAACLGDCA
jgi:hypothetical protein